MKGVDGRGGWRCVWQGAVGDWGWWGGFGGWLSG